MKGIVPYNIPPALAVLENHKRKSTASAVLLPYGEGEIRRHFVPCTSKT